MTRTPRDRWSVGPLRNAWYVRRNGSPLGRTAELAIRGIDGAIRDARTYGRDPVSSKG